MVEPTPWSDSVDYEGFCGAGCFPAKGIGVDISNPPILDVEDDSWFIACISEEVASPGIIDLDGTPCVVSPVDMYGYGLPIPGAVMLTSVLGWEFCPGVVIDEPTAQAMANQDEIP